MLNSSLDQGFWLEVAELENILIDSLFCSALIVHDLYRFTYMSSLMHLVLVMCDASIVTVLLCLKVNLCQINKQLIQHVH